MALAPRSRPEDASCVYILDLPEGSSRTQDDCSVYGSRVDSEVNGCEQEEEPNIPPGLDRNQVPFQYRGMTGAVHRPAVYRTALQYILRGFAERHCRLFSMGCCDEQTLREGRNSGNRDGPEGPKQEGRCHVHNE